MCLAQGHNAVTQVRLEPVAPRTQVRHSTTEPPQKQYENIMMGVRGILFYPGSRYKTLKNLRVLEICIYTLICYSEKNLYKNI